MSALARATNCENWRLSNYGANPTSSACTYVSVKGSNSAVGTAVRNLYEGKTPETQTQTNGKEAVTVRGSEVESCPVPTR
jgi:hypothetical protein